MASTDPKHPDVSEAADSLIPSAGGATTAVLRGAKRAPAESALTPDGDEKSKPAVARATVAAGLTYVDGIIALVLLVLAAVTRFHRIEDPRSVIFDEAHFNKFTTWYISRHYYVDIHPPLAKLVFAAVLWALGFVGAQEDTIGASRGWRLLPSLLSQLHSPTPPPPPASALIRMAHLAPPPPFNVQSGGSRLSAAASSVRVTG